MPTADIALAGTLRLIAATIAIIVAVSLPLGYWLVVYNFAADTTSNDAEAHAELVTQKINASPDLWRFEIPRLDVIAATRLVTGGLPEKHYILDERGDVLAQSAESLSPPILTRSAPLLDSGTVVGRFVTSRSLVPLLQNTALVALFGLVLALAVYVSLSVLPLRALTHTLGSEMRFRTLTEMSSDFFWESDVEHRMTTLGSAAKGSSVSVFQGRALIGEHPWKIPYLSPDEAGWQAHRAVLDAHRPFRDFELSRLGADGTERHISISGDPVFDASGAFTGYRGVGTDITERKRAESALRQSEASFRSLFESMLNGFAYCRMQYDDRDRPVDFAYLKVNDAFERLTGLKNVVGRNVSEVIPGIRELSPELFETYGRVASTGIPEAFEFDFKSLAKWLTISVYSPETGYFVAIFDDITERKRAEESLRESEETLRAIFEGALDGILVSDAETKKHLTANAAMCSMLGYTREEIVRLGVSDIHRKQDLPRVIEQFEAVRRGQMQMGAGIPMMRKDGSVVYVDIKAAPIRLGGKDCMLGIFRDITERKLADEALQQQHARLLETEQELLTAHESLAEADRLESVGRLAAGVAHEVKNPLTIIRLGTDYLARQFSQESNQGVVDDIRAAIDRAERVITDLLDFSRQKPFARRPTNISEVIDNAINLTKHEIERRNIAIIRNGDDPMPPIYADPDRLVQVFINLLSNAAQAIGRDGSIEIVERSIRLSERDLEHAETSMLRLGEPVISVEIRDNGPGIAAEHEKKLFEPFFTTKPVGEGSGLGLAVVRNIVIMHGGSISISNRPEGGVSALLMFRVNREHLTSEKANTGSR